MALQTMTIAPKPIAPGVGKTVNVTVTIADVAPANGLQVTLSGVNSTIATAPGSVTIPAGQNSVTFGITGVSVGTTSIAASAAGHTNDSAEIDVRQNAVVLPASVLVAPGQSVNFTVTISDPAPIGGLTISLSTNPAGIGSVSSSVFIAENGRSAVATAQGTSSGTTTITATAPNFTGTSAPLYVKNITLSFDPAGAIDAPATTSWVTRRILLSDAAPPGDLQVNLSVANPSLASTSPASVTVPAGQLASPYFNIVASGTVGSTTLTASATGVSANANTTLNITNPPAISTITSGTVGAGLHSNGWYVYLNTAAGGGPVVVNLTSSDTSKVSVPASVTIAAGATQLAYPGFTVTGLASTFDAAGVDHPVTLTASVTDGSWKSTTSSVTVRPTKLVLENVTTTRTTQSAPDPYIWAYLLCDYGYTCGGANNDLVVTFSAIDPATGGSSSIVTLSTPTAGPASSVAVTIPAGQNVTYVTAYVTANKPTATGQYQIKASASGPASGVSPTVTVKMPAITVQAGRIGAGLHNDSWTLSLDSPAPAGGLVVNLSSTDPTIATVPVSVTVPANGTTQYFTLTAYKAGIITITASVSDGTWTPGSSNISVLTPKLVLENVTTSRTTTSAADPYIWAYLLCPDGYTCGVANNDLPVTFTAIDPATGGTSSIVTLSTPSAGPASSVSVTIPAGQNVTYVTAYVTANTPTATGQYQISASATGMTTGVSGTVTVTP